MVVTDTEITSDIREQRKLACSPGLSRAIAAKLAGSSDKSVRYNIVNRQLFKLPYPILEKLAADPSVSVRRKLAALSNNPQINLILAGDEDESVRYQLATNVCKKIVDLDTVNILAFDVSDRVRRVVAWENIGGRELAERMWNDPRNADESNKVKHALYTRISRFQKISNKTVQQRFEEASVLPDHVFNSHTPNDEWEILSHILTMGLVDGHIGDTVVEKYFGYSAKVDAMLASQQLTLEKFRMIAEAGSASTLQAVLENMLLNDWRDQNIIETALQRSRNRRVLSLAVKLSDYNRLQELLFYSNLEVKQRRSLYSGLLYNAALKTVKAYVPMSADWGFPDPNDYDEDVATNFKQHYYHFSPKKMFILGPKLADIDRTEPLITDKIIYRLTFDNDPYVRGYAYLTIFSNAVSTNTFTLSFEETFGETLNDFFNRFMREPQTCTRNIVLKNGSINFFYFEADKTWELYNNETSSTVKRHIIKNMELLLSGYTPYHPDLSGLASGNIKNLVTALGSDDPKIREFLTKKILENNIVAAYPALLNGWDDQKKMLAEFVKVGSNLIKVLKNVSENLSPLTPDNEATVYTFDSDTNQMVTLSSALNDCLPQLKQLVEEVEYHTVAEAFKNLSFYFGRQPKPEGVSGELFGELAEPLARIAAQHKRAMVRVALYESDYSVDVNLVNAATNDSSSRVRNAATLKYLKLVAAL